VVSGSQQIINLGFATTSSVNQKLDTGSFNSYTSSNDGKVNALIAATGSYVTEAESGSFMTTGSVSGNVLTFTKGDGSTFNLSVDTGSNSNRNGLITTGSIAGTQAITGSLISSGSLRVYGATTLTDTYISGALIAGFLNDGMIYINSTDYNSGSLKASISASSTNTQANIFFGSPNGAGTFASTGSIVVSGSNNIIMGGPRPSTISQGTYGYLGGNANIMMGQATLTTSSVLRPLMNNNIIAGAGAIAMTFLSSSVAGGQPTIGTNYINAALTVNMGASGSITATGNIINGATSLLQTGSAIANLRSTFNSNNINSTFFVQNYGSSSFNASNNNSIGVTHYIDNSWTNSFGTTGVNISRNLFQGQANFISLSGSPTSNTGRNIGDNFLGGNTVGISSLTSGSNAGNAYGTIVYGYNLTANANSTGIFGGSAFFGRFNDTGSLSYTNDIVLAVGTGTGAPGRRTSLWVTTGSLVGVSGSLNVIGNQNITGSLVASGSVVPLYFIGTIQTQRLQFDGNPFNTNPASNLGALRYDANNTTFTISNYDKADISTGSFTELYLNTGSNYGHSKEYVQMKGTTALTTLANSGGVRTFSVDVDSTAITGSLTVSGSNVNIKGISQETGSYFVTMDSTGSLHYATPSQALPLLYAAGAFFSTGSVTATANVTGSLSFDSTTDSQGVTRSGSQLTVSRTGVYNIQFSLQIDNGAGASDVTIFLKKNGNSIPNTGTQVTVPSNSKQVIALNIWDSANANDYYELAYNSTSSNTSFATIPGGTNYPQSPSAIISINQIR
jgi:hypothetical protein